MLEVILSNKKETIDVEYLFYLLQKERRKSDVHADKKLPPITIRYTDGRLRDLESYSQNGAITISLPQGATLADVVVEIAHELLHFLSEQRGVAVIDESGEETKIYYESFDEGLTEILAQRVATDYCKYFGIPYSLTKEYQVYENEMQLVRNYITRAVKKYETSEDLVLQGLIRAYYENKGFDDKSFREFFRGVTNKGDFDRLQYLTNDNSEALNNAIK